MQPWRSICTTRAGSGAAIGFPANWRIRQIDVETGAFSDPAFNDDGAFVAFNDAGYDRQSHPGSFSAVFGGEKRFEDTRPDFGRYSMTAVLNAELLIGARP